MGTPTVKVLGGSCHAACGPSFQGTVNQTKVTAQEGCPTAGFWSHCVCPIHTQVTMGILGSLSLSWGHLPPSKSIHSEHGTPPYQGEDKDGQYN